MNGLDYLPCVELSYLELAALNYLDLFALTHYEWFGIFAMCAIILSGISGWSKLVKLAAKCIFGGISYLLWIILSEISSKLVKLAPKCIFGGISTSASFFWFVACKMSFGTQWRQESAIEYHEWWWWIIQKEGNDEDSKKIKQLPGEYQTKIVHQDLWDYLDRNVNFLTHVVWKLDRQPFLYFIHCRYQVPPLLSDIPWSDTS